jgi:hypothetical protein
MDQIVEHFRRLERIPQLAHATFVVSIESNFGVEPQSLGARLRREFATKVIIMQDKALKQGMWTSPATKKDAMFLLRQALL